MSDNFDAYATVLDSPAHDAAAITPADASLNNTTRAIWVGTPGNLVVVMAGGQTVTFANASGWMPLRVTQIKAATTASGIVAVW